MGESISLSVIEMFSVSKDMFCCVYVQCLEEEDVRGTEFIENDVQSTSILDVGFGEIFKVKVLFVEVM